MSTPYPTPSPLANPAGTPDPPPRRSGGRTTAAIALAGLLALSVPFIAPTMATSAGTALPSVSPAVGASATPAASGTATTGALTGTVDDALAQGVVLITVTTASGEGAGTGMVLTADGQVLTNYHVVDGSTAVEVTVAATGDTYTATVVGHDASADVALLQLDGASGLATVTLDDDVLAVGDALTAVGNAEGGGELVAASGAVTGLDRSLTVSGTDGPEALSGVIQTDVGAVPGDSGGPMFDTEGEVAGMTTAGGVTITGRPGRRGSSSSAGQGGGVTGSSVTTTAYAVPIADAMAVVEQIRSGRETDTVEIGARAYLGVSVGSRDLTVVNTATDGPAASAGITTGSVITAVDGTAVSSQAQLSSVLDALDPGQTVTVTWTDAGGSVRSASVTLGSSPVN